jgi:hypothetical protein
LEERLDAESYPGWRYSRRNPGFEAVRITGLSQELFGFGHIMLQYRQNLDRKRWLMDWRFDGYSAITVTESIVQS